MDCTIAQEALSAQLDGERVGVDDAALSRHVQFCATCQQFATLSTAWRDRMRVVVAPDIPDRTTEIMHALQQQHLLPSERGVPVHAVPAMQPARIALACVGAIELLVAIPMLILGASSLPMHAARHVASFEVALAMAVLFVAWRPQRAVALAPVLTFVTALLLGTALLDVVTGQALAGAEVRHGIELAGVVLVWLVARMTRGVRTDNREAARSARVVPSIG
jgi:predicted anti-sigma-YlaC factor YlaD